MKFRHTEKQSRVKLLRLIGSALAFSVVAYLIWQNRVDFVDAIISLPGGLLLVVLVLAFASRFVKTLRWFILLRVVEPRITFTQVFKLSFVGLFTTNVLPTTIGGDVVKLGGAVQAGFSSSTIAASLVIDRLIGMATMATFLPFGVLRIIQADLSRVMMAAAPVSPSINRLWEKFTAFLNNTWQALRLWFKQPGSLIWAGLLSFVHMACTFTMVTVILGGLADPVTWWTAGGLWVLVYFITLIPVSINGLGLQEVSLSLIFVNFAGIAESNSLVLALLMRVTFMIASLPGAFFLPGVMSGARQSSKVNNEESMS